MTDANFCNLAAAMAKSWINGKHFRDSHSDMNYHGWYFGDWSWIPILSSSVSYAKVFYLCSHGEMGADGRNYFILRDNSRIYGSNLPSLRNVVGGGSQLLAFGAACRSGEQGQGDLLGNGFIKQGAMSYVGYHGYVQGFCNVYFTNGFFMYAAGLGWSTAHAYVQSYMDSSWCFTIFGGIPVFQGLTNVVIVN
jgi:hypothetical protein